MNKLNQNILSNDEFLHYASLDGVAGINAAAVGRMFRTISDSEDAAESAEEELETSENQVTELDSQLEESESQLAMQEMKLHELRTDLETLFIKYPNLKVQAADLYEHYLTLEK